MIVIGQVPTLVTLLNDGMDKGRLSWQQTAARMSTASRLSRAWSGWGSQYSPRLLLSGEAPPVRGCHYLVVLDHKTTRSSRNFHPADGEGQAYWRNSSARSAGRPSVSTTPTTNLFRELERE